MKSRLMFRTSLLALALGAGLALSAPAVAADEKVDAKIQKITGEVVDLMCYLDHGAKGEKHKACATTCIKNGGPVGILSGDQLYLIVGDHKPMNAELADKAAQTITVTGKVVERNGMKMIENAQLEK
jgi:hypothetical protein